MRVTGVHDLLVRKFVTLGFSCDARLQAAFDCIARKEIRPIRMVSAQ